jgi:hypothetical protein
LILDTICRRYRLALSLKQTSSNHQHWTLSFHARASSKQVPLQNYHYTEQKLPDNHSNMRSIVVIQREQKGEKEIKKIPDG